MNKMLRILAAGLDMRTMAVGPASAAEVLSDPGQVQSDARRSFIAANRNDTGRMDAVAGSEFVDDRIRLRE